jgi:small neutral amino acid transporter SnatA (MarC family)
MTKGQNSGEISRQALIAVAVAGFLMYLFLFFNFFIFDTLGMRSPAFTLPEGSLLLLLGMQMALDIDIGRAKEHTGQQPG